MVSRHGLVSSFASVCLIGSGICVTLAGQNGMWGTLGGSALVALIIASQVRVARKATSEKSRDHTFVAENRSELDELVKLRLLLNAIPTPLISLENGTARALNAAARNRFGSTDRILHPPQLLFDPSEPCVSYEGRTWSVMRLSTDDDADSQSIVALIDIEQNKSVAEARATSELLQTMGHELMNGLAPIVSLAESAKRAHSSPERDDILLSEILDTLVRQFEGLQRFINGYRKLSRLPPPVKRDVLVVGFVDDTARLFRAKWPDIELRTEILAPLAARFDRDQISQAIWAILQNAVEAIAQTGESGEVTIAVTQHGKMMQITISDNGPGIPADRIDYIFRPYHSTKPEGSGIGLGFARTIAMAHGGTLNVYPGKGASFAMVIPCD
jgi:signal transduction histidine kinase